jgi:hypothetical protein
MSEDLLVIWEDYEAITCCFVIELDLAIYSLLQLLNLGGHITCAIIAA